MPACLGDRAAFAMIFDRHAAAMFRYAVNMLDGDLDPVQDALERAWFTLGLRVARSSLVDPRPEVARERPRR